MNGNIFPFYYYTRHFMRYAVARRQRLNTPTQHIGTLRTNLNNKADTIDKWLKNCLNEHNVRVASVPRKMETTCRLNTLQHICVGLSFIVCRRVLHDLIIRHWSNVRLKCE